MDKGVLVITEMKTPTHESIDLDNFGIFPEGVYHKYDYSFFFNNLKENVKVRVEAFLEK